MKYSSRSKFLLVFYIAVVAFPKVLFCQAEDGRHDPAPEAFAAFAAGWVDYQMGHYAEAMRSFYDAALLDHRFSPGTTGMKACARVLDFPQVADAIWRYEMEFSEKNPKLEKFSDGIVPGLAFWGIYLDGPDVEYIGVKQLEDTVEGQLKHLLGNRYVRMRPLERVKQDVNDGGEIVACEYNVLGLLSNSGNQVYLDLFFIQQWDVSTSERRGVASDSRFGIHFQRKRVSLHSTGFESFFSGAEGVDFLTRFLNGDNNDIPEEFIPKHGAISLDELEEHEGDVFNILSALAFQKPGLNHFNSIMFSDKIHHSKLHHFIFAGLVEWFMDTFPAGSDEATFLRYRHANHVTARFAREPKSIKERKDILLKNCPDTLGADLVLLDRLPEKLNKDNYKDLLDELRERMVRICSHPAFNDRVTHRFIDDAEGSYFKTVKRRPEEFGRGLIKILDKGGNIKKDIKLIPLYRNLNVLRDRNGHFELILESRYIDYSWDRLSPVNKENEAWNMIRFHADTVRQDIDPAMLLSAFRDQPQSTYFYDLVADVGYQLKRKNIIASDPSFHSLLVLAFRHFNDEILHPKRKRIQLNFLLTSREHLSYLASLAGFYSTPEGLKVQNESKQALMEACGLKEWADLKNNRTLVLQRMAKALDPQDESDYAMVHNMFFPDIDALFNDSKHKKLCLSFMFYLDWLLTRERYDFAVRFLDQNRQRLLLRLPLEKKVMDYYSASLARAIAVTYMKSGHPKEAIVFLEPFLQWETDSSSRSKDWLRISQSCAWYADIVMEQGEASIVHDALKRASTLAEGRNANRRFLSGARQLNFWKDKDYPTLHEYIVALKSRLAEIGAN